MLDEGLTDVELLLTRQPRKSFRHEEWTPCDHPRRAGWNVEKVWMDMLFDNAIQRRTLIAKHLRELGWSLSPDGDTQRTRKYAKGMKCTNCHERPVKCRGWCRQCYASWYQKKYIPKKLDNGADTV